MSRSGPDTAAGTPRTVRDRGRSRPRRRGWIAAVVTVLTLGAAAGAADAAGVFRTSTETPAAGNTGGVTLQLVTRQTIASQTEVNATLGYAGSYSVTGKGSGTIAWLPGTGDVVREGGVLYRVDNGTPVFLLYGSIPAWRSLATGMTGRDVAQLNYDLVMLGYANTADIAELGWEYFSWETRYALEQLQTRLGLTVTGTLPLGQAVFLPSAIRVTTVSGALGNPAAGQILTGTSTRRIVAIGLSVAQQTEVKVGDKVTITLPDGQSTPGVVSSVGTVATGSGSSATIPVTVIPTDPAVIGSLDQAPVQVQVTAASVRGALVVPVDALLAQASGGYAVEELTPAGRPYLIPVSLGLFDGADGVVQVTGSGLAAGQRVVVPSI